jgi:Stage II sporulation protein E (SpoIIE)
MSEGRAAAARRFAAYVHWADTPLGRVEDWSPALRQAWDWVLGCPVPAVIFVGRDLHMVYNEAYAQVLGHHHPKAFAAPAADVLGDVWEQPELDELVSALLLDDSFVHEEATLLADPPQRQRQFLRVGSTIRDGSRVVGLLMVVVETSGSAERARAVSDLATALTVAVTVDDVCKTVLRNAAGAFDLISATLLLPSAGEGAWRMARRHRIEQLSPDEERLPLIWSEAPAELAAAAEAAIASGRTTISPNGDLVTVPLHAGPARAVLTVSRPPSTVPRDALSVVSAFTDLVGEALGRAVVFDAERSTAELLQRTLLPANLPQCDEVSIAARYEPVSEGTVAGGDFYDSFFLTDGRIAFLIGDVVGRGVMAATVMGQVRAAARGAALTNAAGPTVMTALDRVVDDLDALWPIAMPLGNQRARPGMAFGGELFVTMLFGVVDPHTGEVELASAGTRASRWRPSRWGRPSASAASGRCHGCGWRWETSWSPSRTGCSNAAVRTSATGRAGSCRCWAPRARAALGGSRSTSSTSWCRASARRTTRRCWPWAAPRPTTAGPRSSCHRCRSPSRRLATGRAPSSRSGGCPQAPGTPSSPGSPS